MSITVAERDISRSQSTGSNPSVDLIYAAWGSEDDAAIKAAVLQESPESYDGLFRQSVSLEPREGGNLWTVTVKYGTRDLSGASGDSLSGMRFEIGRETVRLLQALENTPTARRYSWDGTTDPAPDDEGIIGWDGERAQGVEIGTGSFRFSVPRRFMDGEMTESFLQTLSRNAYRVNDDSFWIWEAGEVLFEGATGGRTAGGAIREEGDEFGQLSGYENMTGITSEYSDGGKLYALITKITGLASYDIQFFKDETLTTLVAESALASVGENPVSPAGGSGIGGTITLDQYVQDTASIVAVFPFPWEITLHFAVSPNAVLDVGGITGIEKQGWEYLDVQYRDVVESVGGVERLIRRPRWAYPRVTYPSLDFSLLNAGENPFA